MYLNEGEKITFLIDTLCSIGFPYKGGSYAIHKLAYEIASSGYSVYVFNEPMYPHENIKVISTNKFTDNDGWSASFSWENFSYNPDKTVTIYTNMTWGNPFNTIHNCRLFLSDYEEDKWETQKNDYIYNFGSFLIPSEESGKLTAIDYNINRFYDKKNPYRKGFGYFEHKYTPSLGHEFMNHIGATKIPMFNGQIDVDYLLDEFNKFEYILTYDYKSYYCVIAALCGAKVIIIPPDEKLTPSEYREQNPTMMCGVSYGFNDISWANETINLVRHNLIDLEKSDKKTVSNFINFWVSKLNQ